MKTALGLSVAALTVVATPVSAQWVANGTGGRTAAYNRIELQNFYFYRLNRLRQEALRRQAEEGGTLSHASKAELQAKLDRINATRERDARRNDYLSLDAYGSSVR